MLDYLKVSLKQSIARKIYASWKFQRSLCKKLRGPRQSRRSRCKQILKISEDKFRKNSRKRLKKERTSVVICNSLGNHLAKMSKIVLHQGNFTRSIRRSTRQRPTFNLKRRNDSDFFFFLFFFFFFSFHKSFRRSSSSSSCYTHRWCTQLKNRRKSNAALN